jgi:histidinol-phosphate aminotransferase
MLSRRAFCGHVGAGGAGTLLAAAAHPLAPLVARPLSDTVPSPLIRIGSNENPYGPGPSVLTAIRSALTEAHRYPNASVAQLVTTIGERHRVGAEHIAIAPGSGDVLRAAVTAFTSVSRPLVTAAPTFEGPARVAQQVGTPVRAVPVDERLRLDLAGMATQARGAGLVFLCNPNNPTGTIVSAADVTPFVERVAHESPETVVLVDEAYFEYVDDPAYATAIPLIRRYPKVLVSRTFSKIFGMAGLRVGYGVGSAGTVATLRGTLSPMGLSGVSVAAASAALTDTKRIAEQKALNRDVRRCVQQRFERAGYRVVPSEANFVMVDVRRDVRGFQDACRQRGVNIARPFPPLTTWARITVGTRDEMDRAMPVFTSVLASPSPTAALSHTAALDWAC